MRLCIFVLFDDYTGVSPVSRPSPGTPTTQPGHTPTVKTTPVVGTAAPNPLASILSKVDISPKGILSALTKTHTHTGNDTHTRACSHSHANKHAVTTVFMLSFPLFRQACPLCCPPLALVP